MIVTYRVFQEENGQYTFREVFYEHDGRIITYGKSPVTPKGTCLEDLAREIKSLQDALALPVTTIAEIEAEIAAQPVKRKQVRKTISHAELVKKLGLNPPTKVSEETSVLVEVG
jgi:hypothetical protein